ncbi:hypothetical protein T265_00958 [Opisthorchis viverrini]|uniref:Uncharacterized protein n=1 Tax=Opisthorchis viverrini TaxID=6198 RepID=A0A075AB63_OPIVI|nr:hypothetical protein T265_00958 [Opisthorchis viverrini]KER33055.1 hypothetical protein T265_00958 [Opisthorchis viverrini]
MECHENEKLLGSAPALYRNLKKRVMRGAPAMVSQGNLRQGPMEAVNADHFKNHILVDTYLNLNSTGTDVFLFHLFVGTKILVSRREVMPTGSDENTRSWQFSCAKSSARALNCHAALGMGWAHVEIMKCRVVWIATSMQHLELAYDVQEKSKEKS